jgi:hypothetical protein
VVIDPYAGTASAGVAALRSGCYFIGLDFDTTAVVQHFYYHATNAVSYTYKFSFQTAGTEWMKAQGADSEGRTLHGSLLSSVAKVHLNPQPNNYTLQQ